MRLFEYDKRSLLASIPKMYAFQKVIDHKLFLVVL